VNEAGLHVIDPRKMKFEDVEFRNISHWDSKGDKFWFVFSKQNTSGPRVLQRSASTLFKVKQEEETYRFLSPQAELINDLLCDWSEELGLYQEGELKNGPKRKTHSSRRD